MYQYRAQLKRVVDGDTVDLRVDLGFHTFVETRFRLARIDAPEVRGEQREAGLRSAAFVKEMLSGVTFLIHSRKGDKYGRWLCEIELGGGNLLSDVLVEQGLAVYRAY